MRIDNNLQQDVLNELRDDPIVEASQIGVIADNGVVVLTGFVCSRAQRRAAEEAAKRVDGVRAVANEIEVRAPFGAERTDAEIARAALDALRWDSRVPVDQITLTVGQGMVTLEGTVASERRREEAEAVVGRLRGVVQVSNRIRVAPVPSDNPPGARVESRFNSAT